MRGTGLGPGSEASAGRLPAVGWALARVALALAVSLGAPLAAELHPPVPLRTPALLVPEETAGSGLAPEASVRISLDDRGVVREVEVLSIEPSSEHDELFRRSLERTLLDWRYAPQVRDGVAEATTLEWRVKFPSRPARHEPEAGTPELEQGLDAEQRRSVILALPVEQRRELLAAQTKTAIGFLDRSRAQRSISPRFVAYTDIDHAKAAETVAGNLEAIFNTLADVVLPGIERFPGESKIQVVVYGQESSYQALLRAMPNYEWSAGFYSPAGLIAFHVQLDSDDAATSLLLHEATHAFLDRHVVRPGVALPRWLGEGFANYVGNSAIRRGKLVPGKTVKRKFELRRTGKASVETVGSLDLKEARLALRRGEGPSVAELLSASPETFYGEKHGLFYATSWLFVHYLRDGGEGWAEERFPKLLLYVAEGYPPESAFRELYGDPIAADAAFREYVEEF